MKYISAVPKAMSVPYCQIETGTCTAADDPSPLEHFSSLSVSCVLSLLEFTMLKLLMVGLAAWWANTTKLSIPVGQPLPLLGNQVMTDHCHAIRNKRKRLSVELLGELANEIVFSA